MQQRFPKPAKCESEVLRHPIAPCEILPAGLAGVVSINATHYAVEIIGYLPEVGEPVVDGYRLSKPDGTAHDVCLVHGRMECTCGNWIFRRAALADPDCQDCKHIIACKRHFCTPIDQKEHEKESANVSF